MSNEPKVVRRNPRFDSALPSDQMNWNVPIVEYISADSWDKWAAVALGIAVLIVIGLDGAWLMGWLPR